MQTELDSWLVATQAKMPMPDPEFDLKAREARWNDMMTSGMARLEAQHANFLSDDFEPNADWWGGSAPGVSDRVATKARL